MHVTFCMLCSRAFARSGCKTVHACLAHTTFALLSFFDLLRTLCSKHLRACTRRAVSQAARLCFVACDHKRVRRSSVRSFEEERTKILWNYSACRGLRLSANFFCLDPTSKPATEGSPGVSHVRQLPSAVPPCCRSSASFSAPYAANWYAYWM